MRYNVRVGVEWVNHFHLNQPGCTEVDAPYADDVAEGFLDAMRSWGHDDIFDRGNANAWSSDFDHPDFGGNSLNESDNVHLCYFAGHGGQFHFEDQRAFNIGFPTDHSPPQLAPCRSMSPQWRLGARRLKWFVIDSCQVVITTDASEVVEVWGGPMQGIHLVLGCIDIQRVGPRAYYRRVAFGLDICRGRPIATAWLDHVYDWDTPELQGGRPIAIAAGASRAEAIGRRDHETLDWLYSDVTSTRWLAWKWRA